MCLFGGLEAIDYLAVKRKENLHLIFFIKYSVKTPLCTTGFCFVLF